METQARHRPQPPSQTRCRALHPLRGRRLRRVFHEADVAVSIPLAPKPMEPPGRRFLCAGCRTATVICSHCDRGHRYCTLTCAKQARRSAMHAAGVRYQASRRGRHTHAERQRRYRAKSQKVTHQGSPPPASADPLAPEPTAPAIPGPWHCCRCHRPLPDWVRQDFLRRRVRRLPPDRSVHGPFP